MSAHRFRAGDVVKHRPSGEEWVVASVRPPSSISSDPSLDFCAAGYPETCARSSDCDLVEAATDEEHESFLRRVAKRGGGMRESWARQNLAALEGGDS